jgi:uncharacterized delta-60 repeat protein
MRRLIGIAFLASQVVGVHPLLAAPGELDPTFGGDGKVTTNFTRGLDEATGVAIQGDGKLVVAGIGNYSGRNARFALARYEQDGSLDVSFGGDGKVVTNFTPGWDGASAVAIQPDGLIVAAGEAGGTGPAEGRTARFALARYLSDGTLDTSFGGDGRVVTNIALGADFIFGLAIQSADEKIVVAGRGGGKGGRFALARYESDGTLDATFGGDGLVATNFTRFDDRADELAIQQDGKIAVAGTANYFSSRARFAVARYNSDGTLDSSFGGDGKVTTEFFRGSFDGAFSVAVQGGGEIVAVGQAGGGTAGRIGVARYQIDGSLDPTFGGDGRVTTNFSRGLDYADAVAIQADGKIVAGGAVRFFGPKPLFALARYASDGRLDATFGGDGKVTTNFRAKHGGVFALAIQAGDGKIVAAGVAGRLGGRFGLSRYLPS